MKNTLYSFGWLLMLITVILLAILIRDFDKPNNILAMITGGTFLASIILIVSMSNPYKDDEDAI